MVQTQRARSPPSGGSPGSAPHCTPSVQGQSSAKAAFSHPFPQLGAVTVQPHQQPSEQEPSPKFPGQGRPRTRGYGALAPSPHSREAMPRQSPSSPGRAGHVTSWAGATRNHPDPEPPRRLSSHQACKPRMTFLLPGAFADVGEQMGQAVLGSCPGSGADHTHCIRGSKRQASSPAPDAPVWGPPMQ